MTLSLKVLLKLSFAVKCGEDRGDGVVDGGILEADFHLNLHW